MKMGTALWIIGGTVVVCGGIAVLCNIKKKPVKKQTQITFAEFINEISNKADNYMITEEKESGVNFVGGECEIRIDEKSPDSVSVEMKIYAKDNSSEWKLTTINHKRNISDFSNDSETQEKLQQISKETLKMNISVPGKEKVKS